MRWEGGGGDSKYWTRSHQQLQPIQEAQDIESIVPQSTRAINLSLYSKKWNIASLRPLLEGLVRDNVTRGEIFLKDSKSLSL